MTNQKEKFVPDVIWTGISYECSYCHCQGLPEDGHECPDLPDTTSVCPTCHGEGYLLSPHLKEDEES